MTARVARLRERLATLIVALLTSCGPASGADSRIWIATWGDPGIVSASFSPMVVLPGSFRPLAENESLDPELLAGQLKRQPPGRRVLLANRYCSSFWGVRGDEITTPDGRRVASPWPSVAIAEIGREWPRTLALIAHCGSSVDLLVCDFEEWGRFSTWWADDAQIEAIRSDPRWALAGSGSGAPEDVVLRELSPNEIRRARPGGPYLGWNLAVGRIAARSMSEAIWTPAVKVFPNIIGCNYQGQRSTDRPSADGNGHHQPQDNILGNAASPSLYGEIESLANLCVDPAEPSRVSWGGSRPFRKTPWTSFLLCTQQSRACVRSAPTIPLIPWIANPSYAGDVPAKPIVPFPEDLRTYDENVRHVALLGIPNFLWWRSDGASSPSDNKRLDGLISEINAHTLGRIKEPADVEPISFLSEVVVTGGRRHDGTWVWRVSASPEVALLREVGTGREWAPTAETLGFWVETAEKAAPKWEVARRRDPSEPSLARPIKPAPPPGQ